MSHHLDAFNFHTSNSPQPGVVTPAWGGDEGKLPAPRAVPPDDLEFKFSHCYLPVKGLGKDFPSGPVVRNPSANAGDTVSIPGRGTKVPRCCCAVTKSCQTLGDPMDYRTPGFPVHHQLPEFAQVHVHRPQGN